MAFEGARVGGRLGPFSYSKLILALRPRPCYHRDIT